MGRLIRNNLRAPKWYAVPFSLFHQPMSPTTFDATLSTIAIRPSAIPRRRVLSLTNVLEQLRSTCYAGSLDFPETETNQGVKVPSMRVKASQAESNLVKANLLMNLPTQKIVFSLYGSV